jgi:hypothetical protein
MDEDVINLRVKMLDRFSNQLIRYEELYNSEEVKIFLCSIDAKKSLESMADEPYERLLEKYKKAYGDVNVEYDVNRGRRLLIDFLAFLKRTHNVLKQFKETMKNIAARKDSEIENYQTLLGIFNEYENFSLLDYAERNNDRLIFNNNSSDVSAKMVNIVFNIKSEREVD